VTGSMRFDQIEGYEPAPPEPPAGTWGYDGTEPPTEIVEPQSFQLFNPPPEA